MYEGFVLFYRSLSTCCAVCFVDSIVECRLGHIISKIAIPSTWLLLLVYAPLRRRQANREAVQVCLSRTTRQPPKTRTRPDPKRGDTSGQIKIREKVRLKTALKLPRSAIHLGQLEVSSHGLNDLEDRHNEREGTSRNEESTYSTR
jgi:hypothetical protein